MIKEFYNLFIYDPLLNALIFLYQTIAFKNLGLAIILLTIVIRFLLFPIFYKSAKHQLMIQRLQPKIKKIQEDYRNNKEKQTQAILELYRDHKFNPFTGFFLMLVQIPILVALYQIFRDVLSPEGLNGLYSFIKNPGVIDSSFLGLINLKNSSILIVSLAAIAQYFYGLMSLPQKKEGKELQPAEKAGRNMVFLGPVLTLLIFYKLPSAIALYWFVSSLLSIGQQFILNKKFKD